jgi:hypothetical protein
MKGATWRRGRREGEVHMTNRQLDELIKAWDLENNGIPPEESTLAARLEILTYRALAEGHPVRASRLASMAGVPVELAEAGGCWATS